MNPIVVTAAAAAFLLPLVGVRAEPPTTVPKVGEAYEISQSYESSRRSTTGSSGNSRGRTVLVERVVGVRETGLELVYDLPEAATAEERAREWQFPARVFKPSSGPTQLLNHRELETRLEGWLKKAGLTRALCGRWYFTWNAFRIDCDPQSVIKTTTAFDLRLADLHEGAAYLDADARAPGTLTKTTGPDGAALAATMEVDPDAIRRARAEADVVVGEVTRKPVTLDAAVRERAKESVVGTVLVRFDLDATGSVRRRVRVVKLETKGSDEGTETETRTETVERRPVSEVAAHR